MAKTKPKLPQQHIVIPDTQVRPGVPTEHLAAAGRYCAEKKPDVIVMISDWWDMASLSSYERKGSKYFHDKSYRSDIESGNKAMDEFMAPILAERERLIRDKKKAWHPRVVFAIGNHENRINRAVHEDPVRAGTISTDDFNLKEHGWEVHDFLEIVEIDGVLYSHFFVNQKSLRENVLGGTMDNQLSIVIYSFTIGHQQIRQWGTSFDRKGKELCGLVAGAFYQHDEAYMGPQGNHY